MSLMVSVQSSLGRKDELGRRLRTARLYGQEELVLHHLDSARTDASIPDGCICLPRGRHVPNHAQVGDSQLTKVAAVVVAGLNGFHRVDDDLIRLGFELDRRRVEEDFEVWSCLEVCA